MLGDFTWVVSDLRCHLRMHLGRNASDYFMYDSWGLCVFPSPSLLKFIHLLHLNQAGVQHLISDLTDTKASAL